MSDLDTNPTDTEASAAERPPSKTRLKQQMADLRDLGKEIVELADARVKQLPMSENLRDAVMLCRKVTAHGGRKRQLQYIGKLLRDEAQENLLGIHAKLAAFSGESNAENARFHGMERWRDRLMQDDAAVSAFVTAYPNTESQRLRQLLREARKDLALAKAPKHARDLFKLIRDTIEQAQKTA